MNPKAYDSKTENKDYAQTPWWVIKQIQGVSNYQIAHDVCASPETAKHKKFWTESDNCLTKDWNKLAIWEHDPCQCYWMNPPFSDAMTFTEKAANEAIKGCNVLGCVKYAPDTEWFQKNVVGRATALFIPDGRINYVKPDGSAFKNGVNFPTVFPLWTPIPPTGNPLRINFKRDKKKYS